MPLFTDRWPVRAVLLFTATLIAAGCQDRTAPVAPNKPPPVIASALSCAADRKSGGVSCAPTGSVAAAAIDAALDAAAGISTGAAGASAARSAPIARTVYLGSQNVDVRVRQIGAATYANEILTSPLTVQNLTAQPAGTTNGTSQDGSGIRIFIAFGPTVTSGTGVVTVMNGGTGSFTGPNQTFFQYAGPLPANAISDTVQWQFSMPSTVQGFGFRVFVAASFPKESNADSIPPHIFGRIAAGQAHTCAIRSSNTSYCWGVNNYGGLGLPAGDPVTTPLGTLGALTFTAVSGGDDFTCGLSGSKAYCWGDNQKGQLGDGTVIDHPYPAPVDGSVSFSQLAVGGEFACGLSTGGKVYCWGDNKFGQLGDGTTGNETQPQMVPSLSSISALTSGTYHVCGLSTNGTAYCWGSDTLGQVGDGNGNGLQTTPTTVAGGHSFSRLEAGAQFTCGIATNGDAYCWGDNRFGALGIGNTSGQNSPAQVTGGHKYTDLTAGAYHVCALETSGTTDCWGDNDSGQLGDGTTADHSQPAPVSGPFGFVGLSAGWSHTCGATSDGSLYCWGDNDSGQLGDGTTSSHATPTGVPLP